ncbi:murein hydrolase activator EnvC family protein [Pseudochrobactrum sp. MP213Fo]|uniref:murein hydrolase activator EnvC family protein n=1 Tax=Pseudochrobactrum sp. MP213Fo TaxID=3022250 RepID=UPI003B9E8923
MFLVMPVIVLMAMTGVVVAQEPAQVPVPLEQEHQKVSGSLEAVTSEIALSQEKLEKLEASVAELKKDQATLTAALIQSAKTDKKLSEDIEAAGQKLTALSEQEDGIRLSLRARRTVLAEVLAALQRMGLNPPPAILVRPDDALASVRSAVLLGAVVPEMREQTLELMGDLKEMQRLQAGIRDEQARLTESRMAQMEERQKQELLLEEKKKLYSQSEENLLAERAHSEELAKKATSLKDLIASLQERMDNVRTAADAAREAEEQRLAQGQERAAQPNENFLSARVDFTTLQGQLVLPVSGKVTKKFGQKDDFGRPQAGEMLQTPKNATITSPSDGVVLFAGQFRSYGQLLILDVGGGYHIVMAGMGRINVAQGQFVLAGEPVGAMGDKLLTSVASLDSGNSSPMLYIEFRKDGKSVDPTPWWTDRHSGRTQDDT